MAVSISWVSSNCGVLRIRESETYYCGLMLGPDFLETPKSLPTLFGAPFEVPGTKAILKRWDQSFCTY